MFKSNLIVIVPAFNEEERLSSGNVFNEILALPDISFCFVNDGSTDQTMTILSQFSKANGDLLVDLPENVGKAEAIRLGFQHVMSHSPPKYIGFLDADSAFSGAAFESFVAGALERFLSDGELAAVISSRVQLAGRNIERSTFRHYISRILITLIGFAVPNLPYDSQSGLKIFRNSSELRNAMSKPFKTRWFFDIELLIRTNWLASGMVWEEPVLEWRDVAGSHLSLLKAPQLVVEIFRVIRMGRNSRKIS